MTPFDGAEPYGEHARMAAKRRTGSKTLEPATPWRLRHSLEQAAQDRAESAKTARRMGHTEFAERLELVSSGEVLEAARQLVDLVEGTMLVASVGAAADLKWLAAQLESRKRMHWVHAIRDARAFVRGRAPVAEGYALLLIGILQSIDTRAEQLDGARVARLLIDAKIPTIDGLAANLACSCGAFGYSGRPSKAKVAFRKYLED